MNTTIIPSKKNNKWSDNTTTLIEKENKYMKLATNKWNISEVGKSKPALYYGYKTKKEAQAFVDNWNKTHELKIEVIKY